MGPATYGEVILKGLLRMPGGPTKNIVWVVDYDSLRELLVPAPGAKGSYIVGPS